MQQYNLIEKQKYVIKHYRNGAKVQTSGIFLGYNILRFVLIMRCKRIIVIPQAAIIDVKCVIPKNKQREYNAKEI